MIETVLPSDKLVQTPCSLTVTDVFKEHTASIFRVEVSQVRKVAGYIEKGRKKMGHRG
jgi:hypothetical protein